jgi:hypothetical protein
MIRKQHEDGETAGAASPLVQSSPGTWLSPCRVTSLGAAGVDVRTPDGRVFAARLALALPYEPAVGDELLLLGDATNAYVVGVLSGSGSTRLALEGDVSLSASGKLDLRAGQGVSIEAPAVAITTSRLSMVAGRVSQVFDALQKTVRELYSVRAGEQQTLVEGTSQLTAKNSRILSEGKVTINGKEIFLG